jgi:hypothetical protein
MGVFYFIMFLDVHIFAPNHKVITCKATEVKAVKEQYAGKWRVIDFHKPNEWQKIREVYNG